MSVDADLLSAAVETMADALLVVAADGRFLVVNDAARRIFPHAAVGERMLENWTDVSGARGSDLAPLQAHAGPLERALLGERVDGHEFTVDVDGVPVWVEASSRPIREGDRVAAAVVLLRDVTERKLATERYRALAENIPSGLVVLFDTDLTCVAFDGGLLRAPGARQFDVIGRPLVDIAAEQGTSLAFDAVIGACRAALAGESHLLDMPSGGQVYEVHVTPVRDPQDTIIGGMALVMDRTDERQVEVELRSAYDRLAVQRSLLEGTLESITDGVVLLDADTRAILCNQTYREMFQLPGDITGMTREEFIAHASPLAENPETFAADFAEADRDMTAFVVLATPRRRVLRRRRIEVPNATVGRFVVAWHDATAEVDLLNERETAMRTDPLTGVPNRRAAAETLERNAASARQNQTALCVALIDVDRFKSINDRHGHKAGDEVLQQIASTIAAQTRDGDTFARWGGEEFIAIINSSLDGARRCCERVRRAIERLEIPSIGPVTVSIGVVAVDPAMSTDDAVVRADRLLYEAKNSGRNRVCG